MKKYISVLNLLFLIFSLVVTIGCSNRESQNMTNQQLRDGLKSEQFSEGLVKNENNKKEVDIYYIIDSFYSKTEPNNKGKLELFITKDYNGDKLALTKKYFGDGHSFNDLICVASNNDVRKISEDCTPMSMCFSVKVANDGNSTIVFGSFNNRKWDPVSDKVVNVDIKKIKVVFENGETYEEPVSVDKGYIIYSKSLTKLKDLKLFNNNGILQSSLYEYGDDVLH